MTTVDGKVSLWLRYSQAIEGGTSAGFKRWRFGRISSNIGENEYTWVWKTLSLRTIKIVDGLQLRRLQLESYSSPGSNNAKSL